MKMKCAICKRITEEDYRVVHFYEVAVCEKCASKLLEAIGKKVGICGS